MSNVPIFHLGKRVVPTMTDAMRTSEAERALFAAMDLPLPTRVVVAQGRGPRMFPRLADAHTFAMRLAFENRPCRFCFYADRTRRRVRYGIRVLVPEVPCG